jgi:hypothetical protein
MGVTRPFAKTGVVFAACAALGLPSLAAAQSEAPGDEFAFAGRGGTVHVIASQKDAAEARQAVVAFFVEQLKR